MYSAITKIMTIDNKIAFISGFSFTTIYSMSFYELIMALLLGIVGGFGGMIGKFLYNRIKHYFK
jgi:hypothetical protein